MMEGVHSSMIYYKNFCSCYNVPPVQYDKKKKKILEIDHILFTKEKNLQSISSEMPKSRELVTSLGLGIDSKEHREMGKLSSKISQPHTHTRTCTHIHTHTLTCKN
jgi:hypothetical protein